MLSVLAPILRTGNSFDGKESCKDEGPEGTQTIPGGRGVRKRNWRLWVCVAHSTAKGCLCLRSSAALWCEQNGVPSTNEQVVSGGLRLWVGQSLLPGLLGTSVPLFFPLGFMVIFTFQFVFASGPL